MFLDRIKHLYSHRLEYENWPPISVKFPDQLKEPLKRGCQRITKLAEAWSDAQRLPNLRRVSFSTLKTRCRRIRPWTKKCQSSAVPALEVAGIPVTLFGEFPPPDPYGWVGMWAANVGSTTALEGLLGLWHLDGASIEILGSDYHFGVGMTLICNFVESWRP